MPVHPSEEEAPSGIYEKIAKDPSSTTESTASEHKEHHNEHTPGGKASAQDMQSKGPQIPMNMSGTSHHLLSQTFDKAYANESCRLQTCHPKLRRKNSRHVQRSSTSEMAPLFGMSCERLGPGR